MKPLLFICLLMLIAGITAKANHITGGEMYYTLVSAEGGSYTYNVRLKLYQRCNSGRSFPNPTIVSVFNKLSGARVQDITVNQSLTETIRITNPDPCISSPPDVCYEICYYDFVLVLSGSASGYVLASMVNFRIDNINNLSYTGRIGALYASEIPGTAAVADGPSNNSAQFTGSDLVIVCANNRFAYSFGAEDADGDELRYSFCSAYNSTSSDIGGGNALPPAGPPFPKVPYATPFDASSPLGPQVSIDQKTGLITGIAPDPGIYVVTVCVEEIRGGKVIATQRKDVQINVASCGITEAILPESYQLCDTSMTLTAMNLSTSSQVKSYKWQLLDRSRREITKTSTPVFSYTFADTGFYYLRLTINENDACTDTALAPVRVYPGFKGDFSFTGLCTNKSTQFSDKSTGRYGVVNSWKWDFGDINRLDDVSLVANPVFTYTSAGNKNAKLIVGNTVGCLDTVAYLLPISDRPPLLLSFADTLICRGDSVRLYSGAGSSVRWTPATSLTNTIGASTVARPAITTTYYADLDDNGCQNRDSLKVRVINEVSLRVMNDTTICQGDEATLHIFSNALQFQWQPAALLQNANAAQQKLKVNSTTVFQVRAVVGGCNAVDSIKVTAVPYPAAYAGNDTTICFGTSAQLLGSTDGYSVQWSPGSVLNNSTVASTLAKPATTTAFVLTAYDIRGCPKPGRDTVIVTVLPKIKAYAGRDTNIVVGQSLQLNASGGTRYLWQPANNLSSAFVSNPVAVFNAPVDLVRYKLLAYNAAGCADSAYFNLRVFEKGINVYVPTGFTPNGDGNNDVLRPILAGVSKLEYFRIYNRFGQVVFSTSEQGKGWDGKINGMMQHASTYVWMIRVVLADNSIYNDKGTTVLVR